MIHHNSPISGVDSWGGKYVATAGYDSQLILWDFPNRRSLARVHHDHLVNKCRFSASGRFLVSASSDYTARVWSVPEMQLLSVLRGHDDDVEVAVPSPDGRYVATASRDHTIGIFEREGRLVRRLRGHESDVDALEWSRDGSELVSSSEDGTVRRWSADRGELLQTIDLGGVQVDTVVWADHGVLYVGDDDGDIIAIGPKGEKVGEPVHAHAAGIKRLVYHAESKTLLSASYDGVVRLWHVAAGGELRERHSTQAPPVIWLRACAFASPKQLVFGTFGSGFASYDLDRQTWDLCLVSDTPGLNAVHVRDGHTYTIGDAGVVACDGVRISTVGNLCNFLDSWRGRLVTGGQRGILFDARSGATLYRHRSPLNCSAVFRRGGEELLVVGTYTGEGLVFHEGTNGEPELLASVRLHENAVKGVACNGRSLFSVCATGAVAFHDVESLACMRVVPRAHERVCNGAAVLPDGRFVSVARDRVLRLWSDDGSWAVPTPHDHSVKCVSVSGDGTLIAAGAFDGKVALFDWRRGEWIQMERLSAFGISALAPAPNPSAFLASCWDGRVYEVGASVVGQTVARNGHADAALAIATGDD